MARFKLYFQLLSISLLFCGSIVVEATSSDREVDHQTTTHNNNLRRKLQEEVTEVTSHLVSNLSSLVDKLKKPKQSQRKPSWWLAYRKQMRSYQPKLQRCDFLKGKIPETGTTCTPKRDGFMCMFGEQQCESKEYKGETHPTTKCECQSDGKWNCENWKPCDAINREGEPSSSCPLEPPFGRKCSEKLECEYGLEKCCGKEYPSIECYCDTASKRFICKNTDVCLDPNCWGNPDECPRKEPSEKGICKWSEKTECLYGLYCCCNGPCFPERKYTCERGKTVLEFLALPRCVTCDPDPEEQCPRERPVDGKVCRLDEDLTCQYDQVCCCGGGCFYQTQCRCEYKPDSRTGHYFCETKRLGCPICEPDPPEKCPLNQPEPGSKCTFQDECTYGEVCCCNGPCFPETTCTCDKEEVVCQTIALRCPTCDNRDCPLKQPMSGDKCDWLDQSCAYGEVCCCDECYDETVCTCDRPTYPRIDKVAEKGALTKIGEVTTFGEVTCSTIAIRCAGPCEKNEVVPPEEECPSVQPESGNACLWFDQKCLYGKSCCCDGQCYEDTVCTCTPSDDKTTGEATCEPIDIDCPDCCPTDQPMDGTLCDWFDVKCPYGKVCCCDGQCYEEEVCICDSQTDTVSCFLNNVACTGCDEGVLPEIHGQKCQGEGLPKVVQVGQDCSCCGYCSPEFECRCAEDDGFYDCEKLTHPECDCPASPDERCPDVMPTTGVSCDSSGGSFVCQYDGDCCCEGECSLCACLDGTFDCQPLIYQCLVPCRQCWPELEGEPAEGATERIKSENPELTVILVEEGSVVTADYSFGRVRIFFDKDGNVVGTPCVG